MVFEFSNFVFIYVKYFELTAPASFDNLIKFWSLIQCIRPCFHTKLIQITYKMIPKIMSERSISYLTSPLEAINFKSISLRLIS